MLQVFPQLQANPSSVDGAACPPQGSDPIGEPAPLPGKESPSPIPPEHGDLGEGWLPRAASLHTGYIGHKPRQSSAFNYHGREVAQQSETIESGSPETARSGQLTAQLRDITRHLPAQASTAQSPPWPCAPISPWMPQPAPLDQHWGKTELLGSLGTPTELGCTPRTPGHSPKQGHSSTSTPQGKPTPTPACSSAGQALLPCTPQPPGLPLNPTLQTFPGLGKPLNQAVAGSMCCSLALAGARGCELHHLLPAGTMAGQG